MKAKDFTIGTRDKVTVVALEYYMARISQDAYPTYEGQIRLSDAASKFKSVCKTALEEIEP